MYLASSNDSPEKLPGEISRSKVRKLNVVVALVDTAAIENVCLLVKYETNDAGRYSVVCVDHLFGTKSTSKSMAESFMSDPASFCSCCYAKVA